MEALRASQFDWDKDCRTLTGEISELRLPGFPDQILISSEKTPTKFMFEAVRSERRDGDLLFVEYKPVQTQSALADIRIFIYND